ITRPHRAWMKKRRCRRAWTRRAGSFARPDWRSTSHRNQPRRARRLVRIKTRRTRRGQTLYVPDLIDRCALDRRPAADLDDAVLPAETGGRRTPCGRTAAGPGDGLQEDRAVHALRDRADRRTARRLPRA